MDMRQRLFLGLLVCSMPMLGCASKSGNNLQSSTGGGISKTTTPAPFNNPKYPELVREIEEAGGSQITPHGAPSASSG